MRLRKIYCFVFFLLLFGIAAWSQDYKIISDISYRSTGDEYALSRCKLDLYVPANIKDYPTVVWFHGGGLTSGERFIPDELKDCGLGIVAVNYRLLPKADLKDCIDDAAAGHSAGGYLTNMIGLDKKWLAKYDIDADSILALAPFSGHAISHFAYRESKGMRTNQPSIDEYAPLYYVRGDAPAMIIISGDRDMELLGRYEETAYLWRMMKENGHKKTYLYELDGFDHGSMVSPAFHILKNHIQGIIGHSLK